ncbi:fibronectin type III domain-containing protein [Actinomadura sp. 6N118]|uniref:fibronectin type III domain-containing protein n=1 Tax=Actinomadura sp. 6N118 TaxID=3375151 RepID=UPI0037ADB8ED
MIAFLRRVVSLRGRPDGDGPGLRRLPLVLVACLCAVAMAAAAVAAVRPVSGLELLLGGHWLYNSSDGSTYHVNGASKTVDAGLKLPGLGADTQVVHSPSSGFVLGRERVTEFGKSDLRVLRTYQAPATDERPVALEVPGGPYAVYRKSGVIFRMSDPPAVIKAGAGYQLGDPVVTPDGSLWLHRLGSTGHFCKLGPKDTKVTCPAYAPAGHKGALTVVGGRPVFVDTTSDELVPVKAGELGEGTPIGTDLSDGALVAPVDAAGKVAVVDRGQMHMADASTLGTDRAGKVKSVRLPSSGAFSPPSVSGTSVVLFDQTNNTVHTYRPDGEPIPGGRMTMPPSGGPADPAAPRLHRGEDRRLYVDDPKGQHVLVVDPDGRVGRVEVPGNFKPKPNPPQPPPPEKTIPPSPPEPERSIPPSPPGQERSIPPSPPGPKRPSQPSSPASPRPPKRDPVPAGPPGAPSVKYDRQGGTVVVTWTAPEDNGAPVTGYTLTWKGSKSGTVTFGKSRRSYQLAGLTPGGTYTITVRARNRVGLGTAASVKVRMVGPVVVLTRGETGDYNENCQAPQCAKMHIEMSGFEPNTQYHIEPVAPNDDYSNPGATVTTNGSGYEATDRFDYNGVGERVYIVVEKGGTEVARSRTIVWPNG